MTHWPEAVFLPVSAVASISNPENTIRLGYARATRTGGLVDYKGDRRLNAFAQRDGTIVPASTMLYDRKFYGNPDMPSEKLESLEIGYLGDWRASRMSLDIRAFIEKNPEPPAQRRANGKASRSLRNGSCGSITADFTTPVQRVQTEGIEYQWRWQPFETTRVMLGQALTRIKSEFLDSLVNDSSISINGNLVRWSALTNHSAPRLGSSLLLMQKLPYNMQFQPLPTRRENEMDAAQRIRWLHADRCSLESSASGWQTAGRTCLHCSVA